MQKKRSSTKDVAGRHRQERETGGWKKKWKNRLPIALIYPNQYAVGMSNLGLQLVYGLLNNVPDIVCERIFLPDALGPPTSIESGRLASDFPLLLFSISFEHDFVNLIKILVASNIPPLAADRVLDENGQPTVVLPAAAGGRPLVMAGGVATFINPEPIAPFIDCFIIGEAEPVLPAISSLLCQRLTAGGPGIRREELLHELARTFSCCYVPHLYTYRYNPDTTLAAITPTEVGIPDRIRKAIMVKPPATAPHSQILSSDAEFAGLYMTELGRGCSRSCRFCAAGFVYRPPRLWPATTIINGLDERPPAAARIGLLGMEMAAPHDLATIADYLRKEACSLSFSSLRADVISPQLIELLATSGLKTAAIAPDGGSERLRRVINKGITEDDLLTAAAALLRVGVGNLKLYFMVGLPTEDDNDIRKMAALTLKIRDRAIEIGSRLGKMSRLTLSVNCFIPKPWTPFQFHPFAGLRVLKQRIRYLRQLLTGIANIRIKVEKPEKSYFQAVLALGDRRLAPALLALAQGDGNWQHVLKQHSIKPEEYCLRSRTRVEVMPWEIIDHGIDKNFLWAEYQKALAGRTTSACDTAVCKKCGVCHGCG